jgi:hypothetical protein
VQIGTRAGVADVAVAVGVGVSLSSIMLGLLLPAQAWVLSDEVTIANAAAADRKPLMDKNFLCLGNFDMITNNP